MRRGTALRLLLLCWIVRSGHAFELRILPEYLRAGPDGDVVAADSAAAGHPRASVLAGARAGYISLQVVAALPWPGEYSLEVTPPNGLQVDVFREWYHTLARQKISVPDALVPLRMPYRSRLPEPDNRIEGQKAQAFWIDVWIPPDAREGDYSLDFRLNSSERVATARVRLRVLAASIPEEDAVTIDHNSYGSSWLGDLYPQLRQRTGSDFYRSDAFFQPHPRPSPAVL